MNVNGEIVRKHRAGSCHSHRRNYNYNYNYDYGTIIMTSASANAAGPGPITSVASGITGAPQIIKVHSRRAVHDMLHNYGYNRVRFLSQRTSYDGTPVYKYRACKRHRAYHIQVNVNGEIVHKHRAGWCHSHRRNYNYNYNY